jgi:hypothetical protein
LVFPGILLGVLGEKVSTVVNMLAMPLGKVSVEAGGKNSWVLEVRLVPAV